MNVKTNVQAGCLMGIRTNRCETLQRQAVAIKVKTNVKAGSHGSVAGIRSNRCETMRRKATAKSRRAS